MDNSIYIIPPTNYNYDADLDNQIYRRNQEIYNELNIKENSDNKDSNDKTEINDDKDANWYIPQIDETYIPSNPKLPHYNCQLYLLMRMMPEIIIEINQAIINLEISEDVPAYISIKNISIPLTALYSINFAMGRDWCTHQTIARYFLVAENISNTFNWNSVYTDNWNDELIKEGF